jgi:hypothetical protein
MKKIIATSSHAGGVNAISSVIKSMANDGLEMVVINSNGSEAFQKNELDYVSLNRYGVDDNSVKSSNKILEQEDPSDIGLILLGQGCQDDKNRELMEHSMAIAARSHSIPTLSVSDFWAFRPKYFSDAYDLENGKLKFLTTKIAILDNIHKKILIDQGFPADKLEITGNPYFDAYKNITATFNEDKNNGIRKKLNLTQEDKIVLFASQPIVKYHGINPSNKDYLGYTEFSALDNVARVVDSLNKTVSASSIGQKTKLLVKLHPMENKDDFNHIKDKYNFIEFIDPNFSTVDAMLVCDVVTSMYSTILVESTLLDKPSLSVQPGLVANDPLPTNDLGITVPIYSNMRLKETLEKSLFDDKYKAHLKENRMKLVNDGKSTERVKSLAYSMMLK